MSLGEIKKTILEDLDQRRNEFFDSEGQADEQRLLRHIAHSVNRLLRAQRGFYLDAHQKKMFIAEIAEEAIGLGPIQHLLNDPGVSEIMVNGPHRVYAEREGRLQITDVDFKDRHRLFYFIEKVLAPIGRRIDQSEPYVDARLHDGSRVNVIIPPLAVDGPILTIRKFNKKRFDLESLIRLETLSRPVADFLVKCVKKRLNILISGGASTGKTTTLNVLANFIPQQERIVTIEDTLELNISNRHVVRLETRLANIEGKGAVTIRALLRNALHMRPDRVIIGEVRGDEVLDMLQAMNIGHDGSLTTIHANSTHDAITRLETMALMAGGNIPSLVVRRQIIAAVDLLIHQKRFPDGSRRIIGISEIAKDQGWENLSIRNLFTFKAEGETDAGKVEGCLESTGVTPACFKLKGENR